MTRIYSRSEKRAAFTLVELMVVILIIAILVSLAAAGVAQIMGKIPETQTRTEISDMEKGLASFMADFNLDVPPPSSLMLYQNVASYPPGDASLAFLNKVFGRNLGSQGAINWGGADGTILSAEQCLVFYLAGINQQGFSFNTMNPTPVAGQKTHGPYFTFQTSRLIPGAGGYPVYIDPWQTKAGPNYATLGGSPYVYFSSLGINNGYTNTSGYGAFPYFITGTAQYTNPNTYQIISAGKNGAFGGSTGWVPSSGATGNGVDDQANFSAKVLGVGQQ